MFLLHVVCASTECDDVHLPLRREVQNQILNMASQQLNHQESSHKQHGHDEMDADAEGKRAAPSAGWPPGQLHSRFVQKLAMRDWAGQPLSEQPLALEELAKLARSNGAPGRALRRVAPDATMQQVRHAAA
jgi:hypothetical protein